MSPRKHLHTITRHTMVLTGAGVITLIFIVAIAMYIAGIVKSQSSFDGGYAESLSAPVSMNGDGSVAYSNDSVARSTGSDDGGAVEMQDRKVIQTGSVSLVVQNTDDTIDRISAFARQVNGVVSNVDIHETSDNKKRGTLTIRIPASDFDTTMAYIKGVAVTVEREQVNTQDVTEEFVDLEARLRNFLATEEQYLTFLTEATDVEDMLAVQQQLTRVREDIERIEGRMQYLDRQSDMSTIRVSLVSEADVEVFGVVWSPLQEVKAGVREFLGGIVVFVNFVIAAFFYLPLIVLWGALLLAVLGMLWKAGVWVRKKIG